MNPPINNCSRISSQQPRSPIYHEAGSDPVRNYNPDLKLIYIPTIMNGHVSAFKNDDSCIDMNYKVSYIIVILEDVQLT